MDINFTKVSPGGNETIIVQSPVPRDQYAAIAQLLMSSPYITGEQVGYLTLNPSPGIDARVDMMGGEFCVNALRSAAASLALETTKTQVILTSSGTDAVFECETTPQSLKKYNTSVTLSLNSQIRTLAEGISIVHLDGISHILSTVALGASVDSLAVFQALRSRYERELKDLPAFGIIPYQRRTDGYEIFPVIYVRDTQTIVRETGCGSGSIALALILEDSEQLYTILQPSGSSYRVGVVRNGSRTSVTLSGDVAIVMQGIAFIDERTVPQSS